MVKPFTIVTYIYKETFVFPKTQSMITSDTIATATFTRLLTISLWVTQPMPQATHKASPPVLFRPDRIGLLGKPPAAQNS